MATLDHPATSRATTSAQAQRPAGSVRFDLGAALFALWFMTGVFIDGYAHNHGLVDTTFFTPYHALLYSGVLASGLYLGLHQYRNIGQGYPFSRALPYGYNVSLFGVGLFFVGGGFDLIWHTLFGFEANLSTLLSPSHMLLATSGFLILSGPLRAAWRRTNIQPSWGNLLPVVITLLLLTSLLTFFTQFANLFARGGAFAGRFPPGNQGYISTVGVAQILFPAAILSGVLLFAVRRWWRLPFGAVTLIVTVNAIGMMVVQWRGANSYGYVIGAAVAAGIVGDVILRVWKPSRERPFGLRLFGFVVPFVLSATFFGLLIVTVGIWWPIHMWLGVSFFAAVIGLMLSLLVLPPAFPEEA